MLLRLLHRLGWLDRFLFTLLVRLRLHLANTLNDIIKKLLHVRFDQALVRKGGSGFRLLSHRLLLSKGLRFLPLLLGLCVLNARCFLLLRALDSGLSCLGRQDSRRLAQAELLVLARGSASDPALNQWLYSGRLLGQLRLRRLLNFRWLCGPGGRL